MSKNCPVFLLNQLKWLFGHLVSKHQIYISNRIKYSQLPASTRLNVSISQAVLFQKYSSHFCRNILWFIYNFLSAHNCSIHYMKINYSRPAYPLLYIWHWNLKLLRDTSYHSFPMSAHQCIYDRWRKVLTRSLAFP